MRAAACWQLLKTFPLIKTIALAESVSAMTPESESAAGGRSSGRMSIFTGSVGDTAIGCGADTGTGGAGGWSIGLASAGNRSPAAARYTASEVCARLRDEGLVG